MFSQSYTPFVGGSSPSSPINKKPSRILSSSRPSQKRSKSSRSLIPSMNPRNSKCFRHLQEGQKTEENNDSNQKQIWEELRRSLRDLNNADFQTNDLEKKCRQNYHSSHERLVNRPYLSQDLKKSPKQSSSLDQEVQDFVGSSRPSSSSFPPRTMVLNPNGEFYAMVPMPPLPFVRGAKNSPRLAKDTKKESMTEERIAQPVEVKGTQEEVMCINKNDNATQPNDNNTDHMKDYGHDCQDQEEEEDLSLAPPHIIAVEDYDFEDDNSDDESILSELTWGQEWTIGANDSFDTC